MIAETVFNVFEALSDKEKQRFYFMIGVKNVVPKEKPKRKPVITKEESMEYLIRKLKKPAGKTWT